MGKLDGKVAVITAATSGMALATAKLFVNEGAYVFITGRRQKQLDDAVKAIGRNVTGVQGDAANLADLDRLYDVREAREGPHRHPVRQCRLRRVRADRRGDRGAFRQDLRPERPRHALHGAEGPAAGRRRRIDHHERLDRQREGLPAFGVYNASKAAIRSFARTWTVELKARNIRVNVLSPGTIDTAIFDGLPKGCEGRVRRMIPRGTIGRPEEIATAALFLASSDSSFVTGIELFVDGGVAQI